MHITLYSSSPGAPWSSSEAEHQETVHLQSCWGAGWFQSLSLMRIQRRLSLSQFVLLLECNVNVEQKVNNIHQKPYFLIFSSDCCLSFSRSMMDSWASFRSPSSFLLALSRSMRSFFSCSSDPSSYHMTVIFFIINDLRYSNDSVSLQRNMIYITHHIEYISWNGN